MENHPEAQHAQDMLDVPDVVPARVTGVLFFDYEDNFTSDVEVAEKDASQSLGDAFSGCDPEMALNFLPQGRDPIDTKAFNLFINRYFNMSQAKRETLHRLAVGVGGGY